MPLRTTTRAQTRAQRIAAERHHNRQGGLAAQTTQTAPRGAVRRASRSPQLPEPPDTVDNVNREALAVMGSGVAFALGTDAESIGGVNGVAPHDKRHRTRVP
jgi:hypothetical protein